MDAPSAVKLSALAITLAFVSPAASFAATVAFNRALTFEVDGTLADPSAGSLSNVTTSAPATIATTGFSASDANGSSSAFASADLATGQLKVSASSSAPLDSAFPPYVQTNASFGDGFTTTTSGGTPFAWTSTTTAQFSIQLSGVISAILNGDASTLSAVNGGMFLDLAIYRPKTVNPGTKLVGDPNAIANYFWTFGGTTQTIYYTDFDGNTVQIPVTEAFDDLPSVLTADFTPGGDFDWTLLLGASGQATQGSSFDIDLSHTLTLSYVAPEGAITASNSGEFRNITNSVTDVPEPASMTILLVGLAGYGAMRRRKA